MRASFLLSYIKFISNVDNRLILSKSRLFCTQVSRKVENDVQTNDKVIRVAIIGVPNVGKSTFINNLIDHRVCPTSNKVHTTRTASKAISVKNNAQLILFDTPGLVTSKEIKKHQLESSFVHASRHSIQNADLIGVLHDVSNPWTRNAIHPIVLDLLRSYPKLPSFLVLNKIDLLKSKRVLLDLVKTLTENKLTSDNSYLTKPLPKRRGNIEGKNPKVELITDKNSDKHVGWPNFSDVFMVSSITGDGLSKVMNFLLSRAKTKVWEHDANTFSDQTHETIIEESVRARLLDYLPQEIPYLLNSQIEYFSENRGTIYASVQVTCPNNRIEKLVCGESNGKLRQITERVTSDLVETFGKPISLTVVTIVKRRE